MLEKLRFECRKKENVGTWYHPRLILFASEGLRVENLNETLAFPMFHVKTSNLMKNFSPSQTKRSLFWRSGFIEDKYWAFEVELKPMLDEKWKLCFVFWILCHLEQSFMMKCYALCFFPRSAPFFYGERCENKVLSLHLSGIINVFRHNIFSRNYIKRIKIMRTKKT